jgi:hypothetical protein
MLAQLSSDIYQSSAGLDKVWSTDDVIIGLKRTASMDILVLRGSQTAEDWIRDADAAPRFHRQLGCCHAGFLAGMDDVFAEVRGQVRPQLAITGHSLGGARARILAGLFVCSKTPIDRLCVFGSPKPAFKGLAQIIQKSGMAHSSYRHVDDLVPTLPPNLLPWEHTEPWIELQADPSAGMLKSLRDHASSLYVAALSVPVTLEAVH